MSDEQQPLFIDDPKRVVLRSFDDLALCEIIRYGLYNRKEMVEPLGEFYWKYVMKVPEDRRFAIFRHVARFVEDTSHVSTNAFLPFIVNDNSRMLVSSAVIDYVSLGPLTDSDPMSRVKDIVGMIESARLENEGAAFGGLLNLGDERVCRLLIPLRGSIDRDAMNEVVKCATGFIYAATADFHMDWLEGIGEDDRHGAFGIVASGLALLKKKSLTDEVFTGHRPFPARGARREQLLATYKPISFAEYLKHIAPRMYELERSEPPPRVMPHVLSEWGLEPRTHPTATARFQ